MWAAVVSAVGTCDALVDVVEPTPDTTHECVLITLSKWTILLMLTSTFFQEITHDISIV